MVGAPERRSRHAAVWTGSMMLVWGGEETNTGGRYDPQNDEWLPMSVEGSPDARMFPSAVWTGSRMLIWGGEYAAGPIMSNSGGQYDPDSDAWTETSLLNAPEARSGHITAWTGNLMIVWGGDTDFREWLLVTGGRYDPRTDTWSPTSLTSNLPPPRWDHTAVWTGNEMIIWGGERPNTYLTIASGARYDPLTDNWTSISTVGSPVSRTLHGAVWTGAEMIIWGGWEWDEMGTGALDSGGRYDPLADRWAPTSMDGAPSARRDHSTVWTGTEMIVWGGTDGTAVLDTGGIYHPATDSWTQIPLASAPTARMAHRAVWTGHEMIVWGGKDGTAALGTGGRYDPGLASWKAVSTTNSPSPRSYHTAVWTGEEMIVWGGDAAYWAALDSGGRYDPATDSWMPVSSLGAPEARIVHSAVWTGSEMMVWGGVRPYYYLQSGGRYDPRLDQWRPTTTTNAPRAREGHTAVWTGTQVIIWGGAGGESTGGRYLIFDPPDGDGDGFKTCGGDCDDSDVAVFPGAPQLCDGVNNDCSDPSWPALPADEADADGDGFRLCQGDCNDASADTHPGAPEICDGLDNNCDGVVDEGNPASGLPCGTSNMGQCRLGLTECSAGSIVCVGAVYPSAETCNGLDDDCDGAVPVSESDADGDGFRGCQDDCNDSDPAINPLAVELPGNAVDENCDGVLSCDPGAFYRNHGQFIRCVARECGRLVATGAVSQGQCEVLISQAAGSNTGRRQRWQPARPSEP